jgi:hypothetical protein
MEESVLNTERLFTEDDTYQRLRTYTKVCALKRNAIIVACKDEDAFQQVVDTIIDDKEVANVISVEYETATLPTTGDIVSRLHTHAVAVYHAAPFDNHLEQTTAQQLNAAEYLRSVGVRTEQVASYNADFDSAEQQRTDEKILKLRRVTPNGIDDSLSLTSTNGHAIYSILNQEIPDNWALEAKRFIVLVPFSDGSSFVNDIAVFAVSAFDEDANAVPLLDTTSPVLTTKLNQLLKKLEDNHQSPTSYAFLLTLHRGGFE